MDPDPHHPQFVEVYRSEEKGTDVSLAVHLVNDAHLDRFEAALIISNDSDLIEAIKTVRYQICKDVFVYSPHTRPSHELRNVASLYRYVKAAQLKVSQFPVTLHDERGDFSKPASW